MPYLHIGIPGDLPGFDGAVCYLQVVVRCYMVVQYLDYLIRDLMPEVFQLLDSLILAPGVSWLGLSIAVTLLCIVIGSILMRVS